MSKQNDNAADLGGNQGEGNREAARIYNEKTREFIDKGNVEKAIDEAAPRSDEEARRMKEAEQAGKQRARS
ncbi:MAG: hypothetical protein R3E68_05745 [Burkholderiaceae bacterium]